MITLDILFDKAENYSRVKESGVISQESICAAYGLDKANLCGIYFFEAAMGIKITYNRAISSGTCGERDVYGAQQHAPLMELLIP